MTSINKRPRWCAALAVVAAFFSGAAWSQDTEYEFGGHVKGRLIHQAGALNGVRADLLHPGAARYYREVGLLK